MNITLNFLLLFILVVIPGLIFKRFYYLGEFSKQFSTKDPVYRSVLYAIIPGIIIQLIVFTGYTLCWNTNFDNYLIHEIYFNFGENVEIQSEYTKEFIKTDIFYFILYQGINWLFALFFAVFSFNFIRIFRLDSIFKVLRFKNQWYYIFSGEIRQWQKFKNRSGTSIAYNSGLSKYYLTYADIVVGSQTGTELYSGFVIDYDLNPDNIDELSKVYLFDAHRYRETRLDDKDKGFKTSGSKTKVPIHGEFFVLKSNDFKSINVSYPPDIVKQKEQKERKIQRRKIKTLLALLTGFIISISVLYLVIEIIFKIEGVINFSNSNLHTWISVQYWWLRVLLSLLVSQFFLIFIPPTDCIKKLDFRNYYSRKNKIVKEKLTSVVFLAILYTVLFYIF